MKNRKKTRPISQVEMADNPQQFYDVTRCFEKDALQPYTFVQEVGLNQKTPLYIAVEWDSKLVNIGYTRHGGAWTRIEQGLEEWFHPSQYLSKEIQEAIREFQPSNACEIHTEILNIALEAQKILDESTDINDETKLMIRGLLNPRPENEKLALSLVNLNE